MPHNPAKDLITQLSTNLTELTLGTNAFHGPVRPPDAQSLQAGTVPVEAVFAVATGGIAPMALNGEGKSIWKPTVQLRIRGDKKDFDGGRTLARTVLEETQFISITSPNVYIDVVLLQGSPAYLGEDRAGNPEWSFTAQLTYTE